MYYNKRKLIMSIFWVVLGAALLGIDIAGLAQDSIYSGMGGGFLAVGIMQIVRNVKYNTNDTYKEKIDLAYTDERNGYLRMKAWSWAGYLFVIGAAVVSLGLFLASLTVYAQVVSYCMCAILVFYYISYLIVQKKY